jgi:hypothetical protein
VIEKIGEEKVGGDCNDKVLIGGGLLVGSQEHPFR